MKITRMSALSGKTTSREIPVTPEQLEAWLKGELAQKVMPNLTNDDREFLMTGITPEEWEVAFA